MSRKCVLSHDVGTSSTKTILIDQDGNVLAYASVSYPIYTPHPGWVEQEPLDYWNAITKGTRCVMSDSGISPELVSGIVFTTQAMGIIPVTKDGTPLCRNITWVDGRAEEQAIRLMNKFLGKDVFRTIVGIEITGKDVLPKLMWLKQVQPETYRETDKVLDVNAYLKYKATGKQLFEWSGACSYTFDLKKKDWTRIFFKIAGFDLNKLPGLMRSVDVIGGLTKEAGEQMGLHAGIPVFGGCDDTQSAAVGSGATGEGEAHIYTGSSAWLGVTTSRNPGFKNGAVTLQSADPLRNLVVGITESAGSNIEWFVDHFYTDDKGDTDEMFRKFEADIDKTPPGSDHLIFTPWFLGERCPVSTTTTRGTVFNLGLEHSKAHLARAMCEGIGYNLRWSIENFEKDFKFGIKTIRIVGGGSVNDNWMQILADITGREIVTTLQPRLAGAIGASLCAIIGSGLISDFSRVKDFIREKRKFIPGTENKPVYDAVYRSYHELYYSLRKTYRHANQKRFSLK